MIEQLANNLPFLVFFTESKLGKTGLTVTVDVWRWNGTSWTEIITAANAPEIGDGGYYYNLLAANVNVEGAYFAVFKTSTTSVDQREIPSLWVVQKAGVENLDAPISTVQTGVTTLLSRITSTLFSGITSLAGWLRIISRDDAAAATDFATSQTELNADGGSGPGDFDNILESIEAIRNILPYTIGSGAFLIDITVEDGSSNPIPNAQVSLYAAGDQRHAPTDINGEVFFGSNAETWTVVITKPGFQFTPVQLVVTANTTITYEMTPLIPSLPPLEDNQVHLQAYVFDEFGQLEDGVKVKVQMIETPNFPGVFDNKVAEFTSVGGIVTITNAFMTAWYYIWRGKSKPMKYQVPETEEEMIEIDPILGNDEEDPCL